MPRLRCSATTTARARSSPTPSHPPSIAARSFPHPAPMSDRDSVQLGNHPTLPPSPKTRARAQFNNTAQTHHNAEINWQFSDYEIIISRHTLCPRCPVQKRCVAFSLFMCGLYKFVCVCVANIVQNVKTKSIIDVENLFVKSREKNTHFRP